MLDARADIVTRGQKCGEGLCPLGTADVRCNKETVAIGTMHESLKALLDAADELFNGNEAHDDDIW